MISKYILSKCYKLKLSLKKKSKMHEHRHEYGYEHRYDTLTRVIFKNL